MPIARALHIIEEHLGSQFDRELGLLFIALGQAGQLAHIVGHSEPGLPLQTCLGCGPIIPLLRHQADGDTVLCPSCAGEYRLQVENGLRRLMPTGRRLPAQARQPRANPVLIEELVASAGVALLPRRRGLMGWLRAA